MTLKYPFGHNFSTSPSAIPIRPVWFAGGSRGCCGWASPGWVLEQREVSSVSQDETAADSAARGFSCDVWVDPPGQCWDDFTHATDELVKVLEGAVELVEGEIRRPAIGEEILVPAGALHSVRNIGGSAARWLYGYQRARP